MDGLLGIDMDVFLRGEPSMNFFFFTGHSQAYLRVFDASQNWVKRPMIRLMVQKSRPPAGKFDNGIKLPKPQQVQN